METLFSTPRGSITIRYGNVQDAAHYRELRLEMLRLHPEAFLSDYATTVARPESFWQELLSKVGEMGMTFFATHDEQLIGMAHVQRRNGAKLSHSADVVSVYVRAEWRGLRIADALIEECANWARAHNVSILKLAVVRTNTSAERCYERCGFTVYGNEPQVVLFDGVMYDDLLMARPLSR